MALRPELNRVWTSNNSVARRDPGDAKYLQGWVAEIPTYQVLNYLQYKVDTTMLAQAERGIFEWGGDVSYGVGSLAWDETNKTIYVCTVTNPSKTLAPSVNPSQWSPSAIQVSRANYDSVVSAINNHIANRANPHQVTAAQVGTYNRAEMDALVSNYRAMVLAHASDYNNPHNLTAVQVGAVPVTGGEYTGQVTMPTAYFNESKTAQLLQDNGLWLKNGNYLLGINGTTGNPEAGTAASKSRIVTELIFPDLKAAQESEYAVEAPYYEMALIGSVNILRGTGTFSTGNSEPMYLASSGGALTFDSSPTSPSQSFNASSQLPAGPSMTVCADVMRVSQSDTSDGNWQLSFGTADFNITIGYNGYTTIRYRSLAGSIAVILQGVISQDLKTVGVWNRVSATLSGSTMKVFVNGALLFYKEQEVGVAVERAPFITKWAMVGATTNSRMSIRAFRLWDSALTDKQISTL
ncbi:hypothetical protein Mangalitsa_077 [Escherichia phage Mangalitsa]|uniref:Tail fiber protein n=1 Tax=Escherichia phage Mangalitsa TaxID=2589658 RepID=A0A5B9N378_9CAUD|nr:tail fiber protein [Escherichia phage Mangalitsa]QEG07879.1 hypothetical protein Mangalitsa_077 [Escherichia phage Mangalitsa]